MQTSTSLSSISSTTSSNSSVYGSQTILDVEDLPLAGPRCRSSIISTKQSNRSTVKCRHLFRHCLSSKSSHLSSLIEKKLADQSFRKEYFQKLSHNYRLLLVLNDYQCHCGCQFSVQQGTFVILYKTRIDHGLLTVISDELICSKIPCEYVCDIEILRERVRLRSISNQTQSFDL